MPGVSILVKKDVGDQYNLIVGRNYFCQVHNTQYFRRFAKPLTQEEYVREERNSRLWSK